MLLREWLEENHMHPIDFAESIGVSRSYIYGIMSGQYSVSRPTAMLIQILTDYQVTPDEIATYSHIDQNPRSYKFFERLEREQAEEAELARLIAQRNEL